MPIVLIFNKDNINWSDNSGQNKMFLKCQERYLQGALRVRGTMFVKEVAAVLGIPLPTYQASILEYYGWRYSDGHRIRFEVWTGRNVSQPDRPETYYKIVLDPYNLAVNPRPETYYISSRGFPELDNSYLRQRFLFEPPSPALRLTLANPIAEPCEELKAFMKFYAERHKKGETIMPPIRTNFSIKKVIFSNSDRVRQPATVVLWADGSKTIVKCGENDTFDPEKGLAMAIAKKALGNQGNYYEIFKKWLPKEYRKPKEKPAETTPEEQPDATS